MVLSYILEKIPVVTEDPFYNIDHSLKFQNSISKHWHEILLHLRFILLSTIVWSNILHNNGSTVHKLSRSTRVNFDVHVTSMVQCFVSFALMVPHLNNPHWVNRLNDPANSLLGSTDFGGLVCALTVGYFLGSLRALSTFLCLSWVLFHGFAAMYAFATGFVPYCQPWAGPF